MEVDTTAMTITTKVKKKYYNHRLNKKFKRRGERLNKDHTNPNMVQKEIQNTSLKISQNSINRDPTENQKFVFKVSSTKPPKEIYNTKLHIVLEV